MALLEIDGVTKHYGSVEVISNLSLSVEEHEVICLIGPSGCGKSTLLRCINRLEEISLGEVRIHGDRITGPGVDLDRLRRDIGIVFQGYNLFPHMTVLQNTTLAPLKVLGMKRREAEDRAMAFLERIGLAHKAGDYPDRLSGGQQQRVAIVRALMMDPMLLLLDEITSALDPELVAEVLDIVRDLAAKGMTMMLATHEMGFASEVADRICFLQSGTIYEQGSPAEIFGNPKRERTQAFLRSLKKAGRL
ncbi:amino acid ABC transporter ATP-binding protein [Mesorhizobium sp. BAC0120]|uniref:amino acid ABC transporter ATP-binding protein n=1 Tax=Mesorhizobium sp. BAC0120 TaxID=3090670 RepID=UPI00298D2F24|nr:amino acid ABC transporter ATP-binding protein [Mesorhizobium sp. BAC0120]MDW6026398.1 amino acid ABC transporter ATP-binding protein [Mesorhizobium sp. BAC0120]